MSTRVLIFAYILEAYIDKVEFLPISQYIFLYFIFSSSLFFSTCSFQSSFASNVIPKYFTVFEYGICLLFMFSGIYWILLLVKFICINLISFSLIQHFFVQFFIWLTVPINNLFLPTIFSNKSEKCRGVRRDSFVLL